MDGTQILEETLVSPQSSYEVFSQEEDEPEADYQISSEEEDRDQVLRHYRRKC
jgi:hypothetical protein